MLSESEECVIASGLSSSDHDYFSRAATAGEPFLRNGLLCYFDGTRVEIQGYPLTAAMSDAELRARVKGVIDDWRAKSTVAMISYLGPIPVEMSIDDTWHCAYWDDPFDSNLDVFIDLTRPLMDRAKVRGDVRRASRRGIETKVTSRPMLGHEHIALFDSLVRRVEYTLEDVSMLTSVVSILRHSATLLFEAWENSRLAGFMITHRYFAQTPFAVCGAFDHDCRGASDAVYATMLEYYRACGARRLGLGYATGATMLKYKTKWGTPIFGRPLYQRTWARIPAPKCDYWPWRLQQFVQETQCLDTA